MSLIGAILAQAIGYAVVLAVVCAAVALLINGVRNALHAVTLLRQTRLQHRLAVLENRITDVSRRLRLIEAPLDRLVSDLQDVAEPGPARPGSQNHTSPPPADVQSGEGKA